jgi:hypothetical protein
MSKEKIQKIDLIKSYDVSDEYVIDSSKRRREFVMKYWFDEVNFQHETKPRFKFLSENSELRKRCELILKTHSLDNRNVRFEESLVFVLLISK